MANARVHPESADQPAPVGNMVTNILRQGRSLLSGNPTTMKNLILSAVMVGMEVLLNEEAFNCPREGYELYGWAFILAPLPIIFCANELLTGKLKELRKCQNLPFNIIPAMVSPGMWLVAIFADSDYYVCATVGPGAVKRNLTDADEIKKLEEKIDAARSSSYLAAGLTGSFLALLIIVFIVVKKYFCR